MQPLVSIILPTFGRLEYLRPTVASVYRQTLRDWELIVADDGSDAETRGYLRTLETDSRVTLLWLAHTGSPAIVRNAALRVARGEYVAFLDSDDLWAPEKLSRQVALLRSRPMCGWCYTAVSHIDGGGQTLTEPVFGPWLPCDGAVFERLVTGPVVIRTPSVLAARELVARAGGFDETILPAKITICGYGWRCSAMWRYSMNRFSRCAATKRITPGTGKSPSRAAIAPWRSCRGRSTWTGACCCARSAPGTR